VRAGGHVWLTAGGTSGARRAGGLAGSVRRYRGAAGKRGLARSGSARTSHNFAYAPVAIDIRFSLGHATTAPVRQVMVASHGPGELKLRA